MTKTIFKLGIILILVICSVVLFLSYFSASAEFNYSASETVQYLPFFDGIVLGAGNGNLYSLMNGGTYSSRLELQSMGTSSSTNTYFYLYILSNYYVVGPFNYDVGQSSWATNRTGVVSGSSGSINYLWDIKNDFLQVNNGYSYVRYTWTYSGYDFNKGFDPVIKSCAISAQKNSGPPAYLITMSFVITDQLGDQVGELSFDIGAGVVTGQSYDFIIIPGLGYNVGAQTEIAKYSNNYNAYQNGYEQGFKDGSADGFEKGFEDGKKRGYDFGYYDGFLDGEQGSAVGDTIRTSSAIIKTVWNIVNIPILGEYFTVGTLLAINVIMGIVLFVIKIVRG